MIRIFVLCLLSTYAYAVSNPEIATKSGKSQTSNTKTVSQHEDPLLNSINAYAQQYESSSTPSKIYTTQLFTHPYPIQQQQYSPAITTYRTEAQPPRLPTSPALETNFQPMPPAPQHQHQHPHQHQHQHQPHHQAHIQPQQSPPTPVLMQYLPQPQVNDGGVQYLQLIPTRPLIVPISPYMSPMAQQAYAPQIIPQPQINDFAGAAGRSATEPDTASNIPYGLQAYANSLQNYRSYRFNRDVKPINVPVGMLLNMHEYIPSPNDAPKTHAIKGRP